MQCTWQGSLLSFNVPCILKAFGQKVIDIKVQPWSRASLLAPSSVTHSLGQFNQHWGHMGFLKISSF